MPWDAVASFLVKLIGWFFSGSTTHTSISTSTATAVTIATPLKPEEVPPL